MQPPACARSRRPPQTTSPELEFFNDYDAFLYAVLSGSAHAADYLGGASVSDASRAALDDAIAGLRKDQGEDPAKWRSSMPQIQFQSLDVAGVANIPWENRGTWGEAVALPDR